MTPRVQAFLHGPSNTWTYLVSERDGGEAAVIDPVRDFDPKSGRTSFASAGRVLDAIRAANLRVTWILETHAHADHLSAAPWLKQQLNGARIAIGEGIRAQQQRFAPVFGFGPEFACDGSQFDHLFAPGERFSLGALVGEAIATPGHTDDSMSYLIGDALFTGDSLFLPDSGTARCDFPGGDAATLYRSVQRVYALPDDTRVFVCHDYGPAGRELRCETTIGEQKRENIHVRLGVAEAEYVRMRRERDATLDMPALLLPAVQVNLRAGELPPADSNGTHYLRLPLDRF